MIGIIPAAGKGTRLGLPFPKELIPVTYQSGEVVTLLDAQLLQLLRAGVRKAVVVIRPEKDIIRGYLGQEKFGVSLTYAYQDRMMSREGLTDATMAAFGERDSLYVMLMGDTYYTDRDTVYWIKGSMELSPRAVAGVMMWKTDEPYRFGVVDHTGGYVTSVLDKPDYKGRYSMWGVVAFRSPFWKFVDEERETMSNALHRCSQEYRVLAVHALGKYLDFGTPASLVSGIKEANP